MKVTPSWFFKQMQKGLSLKNRGIIPKKGLDFQIRITRNGLIVQGKPKDNKCRASEQQQLRRDLYCFCDALYRYFRIYKPIFLETTLIEQLGREKKQSLRAVFMSKCLKGELYELLLKWCDGEVTIERCEPYNGGIRVIGKIDFKGKISENVEDIKRPIRARP